MKRPTVIDVQKFSKMCGFTFRTVGNRYLLVTPYGEYTRSTLDEIDKLIIRDNLRMNSSRF